MIDYSSSYWSVPSCHVPLLHYLDVSVALPASPGGGTHEILLASFLPHFLSVLLSSILFVVDWMGS